MRTTCYLADEFGSANQRFEVSSFRPSQRAEEHRSLRVTVSTALADADVEVTGALCFPEADWPLLGRLTRSPTSPTERPHRDPLGIGS